MPTSSAADDRVTVSGRLVVKDGAIDQLLALFAEVAEHVRVHEPGTEQYVLEQNVADPSELWLHEIYRDEAAFVAHGHSPVIRGLVDRMAPLVAERYLARTRILA